MTFSRRLGITSTKALQLHEVDDDLRNSLWNLGTTFFPVTAKEPYFEDKPAVNSFYRSLWGDFFKWPTDILQRWPNANDQLRNAYFRFEWNVIYDFIEFLRTIPSDAVGLAFASACNQVLETEHSGYRFVGDVVTPITSATEVDAIEEALNVPDKLRPVAQHIDAALRLYADRGAPDYRNSIKESISAVEALCKLVADTPKASLGDALRALSAKGGDPWSTQAGL